MAGRGCDIVVRLLTTSQELPLTVGLHTPLTVFKAQLENLTGIAPCSQVLQLLDLRPPESRDWRDPDNKLLEDGFSTLRQLGLSPGAILSLHSIASARPGAVPDAAPAQSRAAAASAERATTQALLVTPVPPSRADHSFAGVLFDAHAVSDHEVVVTSLHVGGMLGRVRVYARATSWRPPPAEHARRTIPTGWGTRYELDREGWALVADERCAPSWDTAREVRLATPVVVAPHHTRGLFVHSDLPDDLGIQYQTYREGAVVAADERLVLTPGLGFTGAVPFDTRRGWYRAYRGPAGAVGYCSRPVLWSPARHPSFPLAARRAARALLLANARTGPGLGDLPRDVVLSVLERCHWDWFVPDGAQPPAGGSAEGGTCGAAASGAAAAVATASGTTDEEEEEEEEEGDLMYAEVAGDTDDDDDDDGDDGDE